MNEEEAADDVVLFFNCILEVQQLPVVQKHPCLTMTAVGKMFITFNKICCYPVWYSGLFTQRTHFRTTLKKDLE